MIINKINTSNINFQAGINPQAADAYVNNFEKTKREFSYLRDSEASDSLKLLRKEAKNAGFKDITNQIKNKPELKKAYEIVEEQVKKYGTVLDSVTNNKNAFKDATKIPQDKIPRLVKGLYQRIAKSGVMKYLMNKPGKGLVLGIAAGNVLKELVGTTMYTVQALTNEDLPKDKRKFIGMYDLYTGLVSSTMSAIFGFGAIAVQDKLIEKGLKKNSGKGFPKYTAAVAGITFLIPNILQTIIGKRIVAPAIATPLAGKQKEKMMAKAEAKKAQAEQAKLQDKPAEAEVKKA